MIIIIWWAFFFKRHWIEQYRAYTYAHMWCSYNNYDVVWKDYINSWHNFASHYNWIDECCTHPKCWHICTKTNRSGVLLLLHNVLIDIKDYMKEVNSVNCLDHIICSDAKNDRDIMRQCYQLYPCTAVVIIMHYSWNFNCAPIM